MANVVNLLDIMTPEDRKIAEKSYADRMSGSQQYKRDSVSPIAFMLAELGCYYGWQAIVDAKRGFTEGNIPLTMEEINELTRAARKIKYSDIVNNARGTQIATGSVMSKNPNQSFNKGMRPFIKEIEE